VIVVNFLMALVILPRIDFSFLESEAWGINVSSSIGVWAVLIALAAANLVVIALNVPRLGNLRESLDAGANSSVLPILTVASLVGFGAVVAALPAFTVVRDAVLQIPGGPLVSLVVAMNTLAALTGTASGGMAIALSALGSEYMRMAGEYGINPELMHRLTTISAGTLDALPHNGTVLLLLQISKLTHAESYLDMVMTVIVSVIISLVAVFILGSVFGSF
jgi:H+/gluconate symporter-like permease